MRASRCFVRMKHEVIHDELTAAGKQIRQGLGAVRSCEYVLPGHTLPGKLPPRGNVTCRYAYAIATAGTLAECEAGLAEAERATRLATSPVPAQTALAAAAV